jgi:uncharacterized protein (DUF1501 family)
MAEEIDRRHLLKAIGLLPMVLLAPAWLQALWADESKEAQASSQWRRMLILVELHGGNDGVNTVVPYADHEYSRLRPRLAVAHDQIKQLTPTIGLHPALVPLMPLWEAKELAVVNGIGYPDPNRSHFRSIEIWDTGSESNEILDEGWLARLFQRYPAPHELFADGIVLGRGGAGPLGGGRARVIALQDPERFSREAELIHPVNAVTQNRALRHILKVQAEIARAGVDLQTRIQSAASVDDQFPATNIGKQLALATRLIAAGVPVAVVKLTHGSFDTHAGQPATHHRLLEELAQALAAFRAVLLKQNLWDRVCVMTYSEFGRRVAENGSHGTDHGTAASHFFLGGRVKGGLYGVYPSLTDLQGGDLRHTTDFRSLYNTVILNWWRLPARLFPQQAYAPVDCLR